MAPYFIDVRIANIKIKTESSWEITPTKSNTLLSLNVAARRNKKRFLRS
jgi:hypothetical protein